jgi:hypothetical protein
MLPHARQWRNNHRPYFLVVSSTAHFNFELRELHGQSSHVESFFWYNAQAHQHYFFLGAPQNPWQS